MNNYNYDQDAGAKKKKKSEDENVKYNPEKIMNYNTKEVSIIRI